MDPIQYPLPVQVPGAAQEEIGPDEEIQLDEMTVGLVNEYIQELASAVKPLPSESEEPEGCPPCPCR